MLRIAVPFLILAIAHISPSSGHTYSLGDCPVIDPQPQLNMNQMLGVWYVIQKTSTASTCITYNFTKSEEPLEYDLEQVSQHFFLGLTPLDHEYRYTGHLTVPDESIPAKMKVKFPLNPIGKASFTVFMTDYSTYAGIFTCQGLGIGHRKSATILSREKTLDRAYIDKLRTRLSSYNVDPFDLSIISQKNCPKHRQNETHGININIDDETLSPQSIAGVVRKAGEKLGDGIEFVASGAKKLYDKVSPNEGDDMKESVELISGGARQVHVNRIPERLQDGRRTEKEIRDAEVNDWLP